MSKAVYGQHSGLLSPWVDSMRIKRVARHLTPGDRVLDIGCGSALLLSALPPGCKYVGVDRNEQAMNENRKRFSDVKFVAADVIGERFPFSDEEFDAVVMAAFIEHVDETRHLFRESCRVLKKSGVVLATTPSKMGGLLHHGLSHIGLLSHEAAEEHKDFWDEGLMKKKLVGTGLILKKYETFQMGLNQLFILSREEK